MSNTEQRLVFISAEKSPGDRRGRILFNLIAVSCAKAGRGENRKPSGPPSGPVPHQRPSPGSGESAAGSPVTEVTSAGRVGHWVPGHPGRDLMNGNRNNRWDLPTYVCTALLCLQLSPNKFGQFLKYELGLTGSLK